MLDFLKVILFAVLMSVGSAFSNDDTVEIETPEMPAVLMPPIAPCSCTQKADAPLDNGGSSEDAE